jgi:hypothetical protein
MDVGMTKLLIHTYSSTGFFPNIQTSIFPIFHLIPATGISVFIVFNFL